MALTRVVNVRDLTHDWENDPAFVYIGRQGRGHEGYFGNPFYLSPGQDRGTTLAAYSKYFHDRLANDGLFCTNIWDLRGKTLVCFCSPLPCHGNVIAAHIGRR